MQKKQQRSTSSSIGHTVAAAAGPSDSASLLCVNIVEMKDADVTVKTEQLPPSLAQPSSRSLIRVANTVPIPTTRTSPRIATTPTATSLASSSTLVPPLNAHSPTAPMPTVLDSASPVSAAASATIPTGPMDMDPTPPPVQSTTTASSAAALQLTDQQFIDLMANKFASHEQECQSLQLEISQLKQQSLVGQLTQLKSSHQEEFVHQTTKDYYESTIQQLKFDHMTEKKEWEFESNQLTEEKADLSTQLESKVAELETNRTVSTATITSQTGEITQLGKRNQQLKARVSELEEIESILRAEKDEIMEERNRQLVQVEQSLTNMKKSTKQP